LVFKLLIADAAHALLFGQPRSSPAAVLAGSRCADSTPPQWPTRLCFSAKDFSG
ncbi:hypothetical protein P7K49_013360, partial [Saguinus oedipus]